LLTSYRPRLKLINMKAKTILSILTLLILGGCKKDYTCVCTDSGSAAGPNHVIYSESYHDTKKNAEKKCDLRNGSPGSQIDTGCRLE
jgi:hypothetical protein